MQGIWNYLFYCTWRLGILFNKFLYRIIAIPLIWILKTYFPSNSSDRIKALKKLRDDESYVRLYWIFRFMGVSTLVLFLFVCSLVLDFFDVDTESRVVYIFGVAALDVYLSHRLCWKGQVYRKYFAEFKKTGNKNRDYLVGIVFHSSVIGIVFFSAFGLGFVRG